MYSEDDTFDPNNPGNFNSLKRSFFFYETATLKLIEKKEPLLCFFFSSFR